MPAFSRAFFSRLGRRCLFFFFSLSTLVEGCFIGGASAADVSGAAPTAAATLPAALPSFFATVVIMPSVDSSGLSFFAIEDYSSARRWAADLNRIGQTVHEFGIRYQLVQDRGREADGARTAQVKPAAMT